MCSAAQTRLTLAARYDAEGKRDFRTLHPYNVRTHPHPQIPMQRLRFKRYIITGLLTFMPLWVTWLVFKFILGVLAELGAPLVSALLGALGFVAPHTANQLSQSWATYILALLLTLAALYMIGFLANRVIGQRLLHGFDTLLQRIPLVQTIYGGTKKLTAVLQNKPSGVQRVVLVDFPRKGMKVVGFVTRVMVEEGTGREMAAVYIPTTPNPTGGYLEVVPVEELTPTDWTMDQAMAFIISGGAVAPDTLPASTAHLQTDSSENRA
jgi:uncharacterized membrane protein